MSSRSRRFFPDFGKYVRKLREDRDWSIPQAVGIATNKHRKPITVGQLTWLEQGRTKTLASEVLRALSALYDLPYQELVRRFVIHQYGEDAYEGQPPPLVAVPPGKPQDEERGITSPMLRPAWRNATSSHRQAALAVLRLGRKDRKPRDVSPNVFVKRRRLIDYLNEEPSGSDP